MITLLADSHDNPDSPITLCMITLCVDGNLKVHIKDSSGEHIFQMGQGAILGRLITLIALITLITLINLKSRFIYS